MASFRATLFTLVATLLAVSHAQFPHLESRQSGRRTVQDDWVRPKSPDLTTNITQGQLFTVEWLPNITQWFYSYAPSANTTNVTLWVTGSNQQQYAKRVATFVNLQTTTKLPWLVDLPNDWLSATNQWTFRFLAGNATTYDGPTSQQISSAQLLINNNITTTTSSTTSSTTTQAVRTGPPTTSTSAAATPSIVAQPSGGLSGGAVAGVAIGAALGALILAGAAFFFWRRRRRASREKAAAAAGTTSDATAGAGAAGAAPDYTSNYEQKPPYAWSQNGVGTPGAQSMPGTPGLGVPSPYMAEMHGSDGHSLYSQHTGQGSYYPPMPHHSTMPVAAAAPPHNRQNSDPVPPYVTSELHGSPAPPPNELEDSESTRRLSANTSKSEVPSGAVGAFSKNRGSRGSMTRRISGGSGNGGVGSPLGSPRVQSPPPHDRIEEGEGDVEGADTSSSAAAATAHPASNISAAERDGQEKEAVEPDKEKEVVPGHDRH